jgi:cysteine desulfurase/selenocysteine lyase
MLRSDITMSTSERQPMDDANDLLGRAEVPLAPAGALPDIAMMTQLANEFFRALPGSSSLPAADQPVSAMPIAAPALGAQRPQFGAALPGMPAVPSLPATPAVPAKERFPAEGAAYRISGTSGTPFETASLPIAGASDAFPAISPYFSQNARTENLVSPFSMPLPAFDASLSAFEPLFRTPSLPVEDRTGEIASSATKPASSLYFLDDAGMQGRPSTATDSTVRSGSTPELHMPRRQFDIGSVRRDFPILRERVNGKPLIWLDNAATTQKPQSVIDRISYFYEHENSNIHRAAHELAARATDAYEDARSKVAHFLNASSSKEIVFVRGATEAINLVAQGWGRRHIHKGDEILITWIEHHANIVPWQMLANETGAILRVAPVDDDGQILLDEYEKLLGPRTRLVSLTQVSNALGTITPAHQMVQMARRYGARVLVDGAQAVSHMPIDVQSLDCDFYVFSGHKVFAPTGIGVLYGKPDALADMQPWQGGGNMIVDVTFEKTIYQPPPSRFEAGTGNIADAVGLGAAIDYLDQIGMANIARYEHELLVYATEGLRTVPGLRILGTAKEKAGVLSFVLDGFRTEEVGAALNSEGIAVRSGHHCAQPTLRRFGVETTVRPSLALYNDVDDIDALVAGLIRLKRQGR